MLRFFDMMYYHLATFYQRFHKKTSGWQLQASFIVSITQAMLILDLWMIIISIFDIQKKAGVYEKIIFCIIGLCLIFYNMKRYEKKYQYYKSIWGVYSGNQKKIQVFLTFFTAVFVWVFVFILGFVFNKYK
ncbi:hypothetical protein CQ046_23165 [Chryseobacterium sp. MYb7]|uniref:hypothetical protein n=1 Tax=Chryseobacterium sp. MYb7 TaxID=1827290 RepID=UPI000D0101F7|nr:hypothetical protein [Chryseobacterium sp. MYb7]PRA92615.1 hypothetical protein CQ046_23165 [Chryseobacterium sp. MYb7]